MATSTRTKHIEVPQHMLELPAPSQIASSMPPSMAQSLAAIAKTIKGTGKKDLLVGTNGHDVIRGGNGNDVVFGQKGNDKLYGDKGMDIMWGGPGKDLLDGGAGIDNLYGDDGNDKLNGGAGNDKLNGGKGSDTLTGGAGRDSFQMELGGVDKLMDFASGSDSLNLLFYGSLGENEFVLGTAAQDADDRIIYDQSTGRLYYDADGNGAGAAVLFAINVKKTPMAFYDF